MALGEIDANGEDAVQHINNALQILSLAERTAAGKVILERDDIAAVRDRLRRAAHQLRDASDG